MGNANEEDDGAFMISKEVIAIVLVSVALIAGLTCMITLTHVDRYYISSARTDQVSSVTCVWAHWTGWHTDEISYCSDDADKVVEWVAKANASLK